MSFDSLLTALESEIEKGATNLPLLITDCAPAVTGFQTTLANLQRDFGPAPVLKAEFLDTQTKACIDAIDSALGGGGGLAAILAALKAFANSPLGQQIIAILIGKIITPAPAA